MKRHTLVSSVLNISLIVLVSTAWAQAVGTRFTLLDIASFLGVIAFSLMWVHYATDAIAPRRDASKDLQYIASRIAVLLAIIAHPLLINIYLVTNGYGLPPDSYEKLVGSVIPVLLGWTALAAFVAFELRGKLQRFERYIFHANIVAMFLICMHGFLIGMVIMSSWFYWIWWLLLISFTGFAIKSYANYYTNMNSSRFYVALVLVIVLAAGAAFIGISQHEKRSPAVVSSQTTLQKSTEATEIADAEEQSHTEGFVTREQLSDNDGKDGNNCWIAVDGTVYDATGNPNWVDGEHVPSGGRATCGKDLSDVISQSPHGKQVLSEIVTVGSLAD